MLSKKQIQMTTKLVTRSKAWHISLWILHILLAGMFLMVGYMTTFTPIHELSKTVAIAGELPALIRFIGISELAAGLGLLLPAGLRVLPALTVWAAGGLALVMALALLFHLIRGGIFSDRHKYRSRSDGWPCCMGEVLQSAHRFGKRHSPRGYENLKMIWSHHKIYEKETGNCVQAGLSAGLSW